MKLIGRVNELTINEIFLYGFRPEYLKKLAGTLPINIEVREHLPKKFKIKNPNVSPPRTFQQNETKRHQIKATLDLNFLKFYLYTVPLSAEEIRKIGARPIKEVEEKEKIIKSVKKMQGNYLD